MSDQVEKSLVVLSDDEIIQREFEALLDDYRHTSHRQKIEIITKAFNFAKSAHKGVRRRSGEPYILHPINSGHVPELPDYNLHTQSFGVLPSESY